MKKFLTVLLVVSVLFTFSFSSAFAATAVEGETATLTRTEMIAKAQKELVEALNKAATTAKGKLAAEYTETVIDADCVIDGSVYAATIDEIVAVYTAVINNAAKEVKGTASIVAADVAGYKAEIMALGYDVIEYAGADVTVAYDDELDANEILAMATAGDAVGDDEALYFVVYTLVNAADAMKADLNAEIAKIDMSLYTNDVIDATAAYPQTYAEKAQEAKDALVKIITDTKVDMTMTRYAVVTALSAMYDGVQAGLVAKDSYTDIYGNTYVTSYKLAASIKTAEDLAAEGVVTDVTKATLKAQLASTLASEKLIALEAYNAAGKTAAAKVTYEARLEALDAYEEVNALLIEEGKTTLLWVGSNVAADRIALYEAAAKDAAVAKIQVEKDGSAKYDAAKVDEILADAKVAIYAGDATTANFAGALVGEDLFAWNKEVKLAQAQANLEAALEAEDFYAPEVAKIEAAYAKVIAKIEAAATQAQLNTCAVTADTSAVLNEGEVENALLPYANTGKFVTAVNNFIALYNMQSGAKTYDDAYIDTIAAADVVEYLAEAGARTNADVAGLLGQAEAFAQTVKNNGTKAAEAEAAVAAATAAIKALPNVVTLADKAAVEAAYELADEAGMLANSKLAAAVAAVKAAEEKAIAAMEKALPAKITVADEAAVDALLAAIEAYDETEMYAGATYNAAKAEAADLAVRRAEEAAVEAAIAAIDAADEASVVAARAALDAYVAEYTSAVDADRAIVDIDNIDKLTYAEAAVAVAKIEAVEALKITAGSTAKKGAITVKWTVKGDTSAVEGYEIWKSTKKNSGFKKAFTTTKMSYKNTKGLKKGTKYFYKVRAIAYVGEEKIVSDWSNKAYRVAK